MSIEKTQLVMEGRRRVLHVVLTFTMAVALAGCVNTLPAGGANQSQANATPGTPYGTPSSTPSHVAGTDLSFGGDISDTLSSANVVCQSGNGQFFFDIVGVSAGGKNVILSGRMSYTGPGLYQIPAAGILFSYGGTAYTGHPSAGSSSGTIQIFGGARSGSFAGASLPIANPNQSGRATVDGSFTCTA
ncbi:MAG TPA: hypothetical protein VND96_17690 [Candidatus Micrarchaeaceae archaeon]|nr:hypothetical protein [Candidatus Micrarchaeaceae archaeon]